MRILDSADPDTIRDALHSGEFFWLDLEAPPDDTVSAVSQLLELHSLALEDSREFGQRAKVDWYGDQLLAVYFGAVCNEDHLPRLVEVHLHLSRRFLFSVHREPCPALRRVPARIAQMSDDSEGRAVHAVIDALTDSAFDTMEEVAENVARSASDMVRQPRARSRDRIAALRPLLETMRRSLVQQHQMLERFINRIYELDPEARKLSEYYRDVSDHLWQALDAAEAARGDVQGALDTYSNEVQERLTIVATIFLPLTLVSSFFGQNFNWMINHIGSAGAFWGLGVGASVFALIAIVLWLVRTGLYNWPRKD